MALPLLALGRAALGRTAATRGVAANTAKTSTGEAALGTAVGFGEIVSSSMKQSPANNVIDFRTAQNLNESRGGAAAPIATPAAPTPTTTSMAGDIAAATELSMEELEKQTKLLKDIEKNTSPPPSAGGQAPPPPTEEEIKSRFDNDKKSQAELFDKLAKSLSSSLGASILALGAALAATSEPAPGPSKRGQELDTLLGTGEGAEKNILGVEKSATLAGDNQRFFSLNKYRFTADEKGRRVAGQAEQEANKEKKTQIMAMIGEGGDPADSQKLETAFREGDVETIQSIEDKYRGVGQKASAEYQYRAAAESFSQADAVSVARRMEIETPDLINASAEEKEKFRQDMLAKQQEFMKEYSTGIADQGQNFKRRASLIGEGGILGKDSMLEKTVDKQFEAEGKDTFFGGDEEKVADKLRAELEGYRSSLRESGLGERATNNLIADELKKIDRLNIEQMKEYTAPKVSGAAVETATADAATAEEIKMASRSQQLSAPPAAAPAQAPQDTPTVSQTLSVSNKTSDEDSVGRQLQKRNSSMFTPSGI